MTQAPRRAIFGWILFDWACQPVATLITTFIYAPYFASAVARSPAEGQALWGFAAAAAGIVIALTSPFIGAIADATGSRKPWIAAFGVLLVLGSIGLWFGKPGDPSTVMIVLVCFAIATIGFEFATVFNNAMMPSLVPPNKIGWLSGLGWATGYLGGLVSLAFALLFLSTNPKTGLTLLGTPPAFGLDAAAREGDRFIGPLTAIWFIIFVLPLFLFTPDNSKALKLGPAIKSGIDTIEHASLVDDEGIKLAAARPRPVWFAMDIYNTDYTQAEGAKNGVLEDNLRKDREIGQLQRDNFRKAFRAGVRMVFASDAGVMPHGLVGRQFNTMVTYGMTPLDAIRAATLNAAQALGWEANVGTIAVGRFADFVAVDGDPLVNVRELEDVDGVIKGGVVIERGR